MYGIEQASRASITANVASLPVIVPTSDDAASQAVDLGVPRWSPCPLLDSRLVGRPASDRRLAQKAPRRRGAFSPGTPAWLSVPDLGRYCPEVLEWVPWQFGRRECVCENTTPARK